MLNQKNRHGATTQPPGHKGLDPVAVNAALHEAHCRIFTPAALAPFLGMPGRSGVFLPMATPAYCNSVGRIIVVGRAPKAWLNEVDLSATPTAEYVRRSAKAHLGVLLAKPGKHKFLQFLKCGSQRMGGVVGALGWCNLFATSHSRASPMSIARDFPDAYQAIKRLSRELLDAQLSILQPQVICFTTNPSLDQQLKCHFGERMGPITVENEGARLRFHLDGIPAWRINHPMHLAKLERKTALAEMISVAKAAATRETA
ncbi:hypothetical protein [Variovorax sp. RA8]|uniref:hypothetical protein n=1 Tax=Variovorax sp. (strain JCM 16519 / RA8) TaxID=662548 RepID=UPI000B110F98|nr:hypothetical protein [Variovorax sp. RA8]VTU44918.1 hypothetical protein RA8P2_00354 [Variovorax sp. RA8]